MIVERKWDGRNTPCWALGWDVEVIGLALPLIIVVVSDSYRSLVTSSSDGIVVWNNIVRLGRVALILCVILVDLGLGILWYCSLVRCCGVVVIPLASGRRILGYCQQFNARYILKT
jgi:hypothetical protein